MYNFRVNVWVNEKVALEAMMDMCGTSLEVHCAAWKFEVSKKNTMSNEGDGFGKGFKAFPRGL